MTPTPQARAALDQYAQELTRVGRGLILDDFRPETREQARRAAWRIKWYVFIASLIFLGVFFWIFLGIGGWKAICECFGSGGDTSPPAAKQLTRDANIFLAGWAFSLGGLGATASIFLSVLKLTPQPTLRLADEFDVLGRLVLGCLFSTIFGVTVSAPAIKGFHQFLQSDKPFDNTTMLLLPFLAGYSIPLVLKILEKLVRAVELTIGGDDPRDSGNRPAARSGA